MKCSGWPEITYTIVRIGPDNEMAIACEWERFRYQLESTAGIRGEDNSVLR
jgi:hypothetical protein